MKTTLYNAKIYVDKGHFEQALLMEGNRIVAVGKNEDIRSLQSDHAIDCQGHTLIPGFNDSHAHLMFLGKLRSTVQLLGASSIQDCIRRGQEYLSLHPASQAIYGMGWNYADFTEGEKRNLTRKDLDQISTQIPVVFSRACGHMLSCNTKALELAGITRDTPQVPGGKFEVEADGPNGCFHENAKAVMENLIPPYTDEQLKDLLIKTMDYALSMGITTVHSNDCGILLEPEQVFRVYEDLFGEKDKPNSFLRIYAQLAFDQPQDFQKFIEGPYQKTYHPKLRWGPLKLFKDGSLGGHSALVKEAYLDNLQNFGIDVLPMEKTPPFYALAREHGFSVITHTIGDRAMKETMDSYKPVDPTKRWGLVHCQITDPAVLEEMAKLQMVAYVQPIFLRSDIQALKNVISQKTQSTSYAFKTMLNLGIPVALGTDSPVEDINPFDNLYCAMERKDFNGIPEEGFYKNEALTLEEALDAYTLGSAYAEFAQHEKGRIKPGYLADLALLDRDIFALSPKEIRGTQVLMTFVDGALLYERSGAGSEAGKKAMKREE